MSLFTHLLPSATERYVAEASRLLSRGGWFLSTWFLLDDLTEPNLAAGNSQIALPHSFRDHEQHSLHGPEQAAAYRSDYLERIFSRAGFSIENVFHGGWSGIQSDIDSGQDVTVAQRKP